MRWKYLNTKVHFPDFLHPNWTSLVRKGVLVNWKESETVDIYIYTPYESHEHSYDRTQDRTSAARPIAMAHIQSCDHMTTRAILSHYLATLAFIVQRSHINARPIARFNAFASQNGRFRSCDRCATTFSYAIISATVYDPNLNFSIARLFGRSWSCANCERAFSKHLSMTNEVREERDFLEQ